ncbi:ERCC4 domain-containing protein [Bacillus velezensis]|uniref:ERCC4 domain-containing protein n=1 Tax=Bacillus velezensis TaxID=492670 RepID=UPI003AA8227D
MMYSYSDTELKKLMSSTVILTDTREQENYHIVKYFDEKKIAHRGKKLHTGDYSILLPSNNELGIIKDSYFPIVIERKNSIDELAQSIKEERFENELIRSNGLKLLLLVEDSYKNLLTGNYRSQYQPKSLLARLKSFEARYHFHTIFLDKGLSGNYIYHHLYYQAREYLKCKIA